MMKPLFLSALILSVLLLPLQASAQIFKWQGDDGQWHFTDNPGNVPLKFQDHIRKVEPPPSPRYPSRPSANAEQDDKSSQTSEASKEEEAKEPQGPTPQEISAINQAISFLKADIQRYEPFIDKPLNLNIDQVVRGAIDQKQSLAKRLQAFELSVLKQTGSFLEQSAAKDEDAIRLSPNIGIRRTRAIGRRDRAKEEKVTKNELIAALQKALIPPEPKASEEKSDEEAAKNDSAKEIKKSPAKEQKQDPQ
ncbi:MAG: DUF4124 domain-containing protein [Candidatus Nitrohelix vancouverensis]|uniref:DUF4124 domain-containing protein n=1 Tax=Candidatus Nitrohelix vancouverensis TaxID=2705534 RepID=A0A7T0C0Y7_9BACT|nr:MAG: DUF4124 domain-containing protein [Candidatus Nitrohelix vancouverensis]